jgi:hypothetical protein
VGDVVAAFDRHRGEMPQPADSPPAALYDVQLRGRPPGAALAQHPGLRISTTGAQTVLMQPVTGPWQLDALLQKMRSVGLVLMNVHRRTVPRRRPDLPSRGADADDEGMGPTTYEIRVQGELGEALLGYLACRHYVVPEQTLVRIEAPVDEVHRFLRGCTDGGAVIEWAVRVRATAGSR